MTVQVNDLISLYDQSLILDGSGSVHLDEKQNRNNGLAEVNLLVKGSYILLTPEFLRRSEELYRKIDKRISLKKINDGTKIKSYLRNLASYVPGEYKELGLIISYPPQASDKLDAENNDMVFDAKQAYIDGQTHSQANAIDQSLRRNGVAIIQASDFPTLFQATFHPDIQFQEMPVFHKSVTANGETIDLTPLLKQVVESI